MHPFQSEAPKMGNPRHSENADPCKCRVCRKARRIVVEYLVRMGPKELMTLFRGARILGLHVRLDNGAS